MLSVVNSFFINVFIKRVLTAGGMEREGCYTEVLLLIENAELLKHRARKHIQQLFIYHIYPNSNISGST